MAKTVIRDIEIDSGRLYASLQALAEVGAYDVPALGIRGVNRLALTDADADGRRLVVRWFEEAGLAVTIDAIGNVYARRGGRDDTLAPVVCGSHIDSVPTAGAFDGCLGVLGALEIVRTLNARGIVTRRPLVVAFFTDEEGCRFGSDMLGSACATGRIALDDARALQDRDGLTVGQELERIGFFGPADVLAMRPHVYLECHIEQGPILKRSGVEIGVVTGVQAIAWQQVTITGRSAHAGTTPIEYRADAGLAAARINVRLREMASSGRFGPDMRATMGRVEPLPGAVNVVPGLARVTVDLRNPSDEKMREAEAELVAFYRELEQQDGVCIEWRQTARTPAVAFDEGVQDLIDNVAGELGLSRTRILSGAGHDAQEWSRVAKTGMVFVPGEHDGISHNPRELSTEEQCQNGIDVLLHAALALAEEE